MCWYFYHCEDSQERRAPPQPRTLTPASIKTLNPELSNSPPNKCAHFASKMHISVTHTSSYLYLCEDFPRRNTLPSANLS